MPQKTLSYVLMFSTVFFSFFSWRSVHQAIFTQNASDFWAPLVWFSLFAVATCLLIVLVQEKVTVWVTFLISLLLSLIFIQSFVHVLMIVLAWVFLYIAKRNIKEDIDSSIRIHLTKSLHRGVFMIVVAFVLMISSQYYFSLRNSGSARVTPNVSKGGAVSSIIKFALPKISPEFKQVKSDDITMDEFLGEIYETIVKREEADMKSKLEAGVSSLQSDQMAETLENELGRKLTDSEKEQIAMLKNTPSLEVPLMSPDIKQNVIEEWKKELSKTAGLEVTGDEKVVDVFLVIINSKINNLAEVKSGNEKSAILPLVFAMILFLSLMPLGSFVSRFWTILAAAIFWVMRRFGWVKVEMETKEAEVIR